MKSFQVVDLTPQGEVRSRQAYDYATLELIPGCIRVIANFSNALYRHASEFESSLLSGPENVDFRWNASADTAGIATIRAGGNLASVSILATGINADADAITLGAFQRHLTHELHDTGYEPAFELIGLRERPLLATVTFHSPETDPAKLMVALADRCFAAAYFRYHQLA